MKVMMFAAMALALAPVARAQDCGPLERVIAAAGGGFEAVAGEEFDDGFFDATIKFFGGEDCTVDAFAGEYYCLWAAPSVADADKTIAPLYDMAKVCLSGPWAWDDLAGKAAPLRMTITEGYQMRKTSGAAKGTVVQVYMEAMGDEPWRQVWLKVRGE